jgi:ribose-phosphate pyrophosphokinase
MHRPLIFTGNANRLLAEKIAYHLGVALGRALVSTFKDGETQVDVGESVREGDVFVIQPTCPPVNNNLMELLLMMDAMGRASAHRMTAVVPYYGYSRQEKRSKGREPISAKLVANLMAAAGANHVLTVDLTAPAIEGFFDIPVDNLGAGRILAEYCLKNFSLRDAVVVSPDVGGVNRANKFRQMIGTQAKLAVVFKEHPEAETIEMMGMVGEVKGKTAIIVDDIISTGMTLTKAAELLIERGASKVYACATHPVFAEGAVERINDSVIERVLVTDSIPVPKDQCGAKIKVASVASLLADAIISIHEGRTMADLYKKLKARPIEGKGGNDALSR